MQGQHRAVPGDITKKRHMLPLLYGLTLFLAFAVHLAAALAGPEAGLSVWIFLRAVKPRYSVLDSQEVDFASGAKRLSATPIFSGPDHGRHYCLCAVSIMR